MRQEIKGGGLILAAAFLWGIGGTVIKFMFNNSFDPIALVNMRLNLAFLLLFGFLLLKNKEALKISKADFKHFFILGLIGITGVQTTYYYTVSVLNVSMAIFLQYLSPGIVALYSWLILKEELGRIKLFALGAALVGTACIVLGKDVASVPLQLTGVITGLASAFFVSFYYLYGKKCVMRCNPWTVLTYCFGSGAIVYWLNSPPWKLWQGISINNLWFVLYIVIFSTILPFGLYLSGLRYLSPTAGSIIAMFEPLVASFSAYLVLGEAMTLIQIMGGFLIIIGIAVLQIPQNFWHLKNDRLSG